MYDLQMDRSLYYEDRLTLAGESDEAMMAKAGGVDFIIGQPLDKLRPRSVSPASRQETEGQDFTDESAHCRLPSIPPNQTNEIKNNDNGACDKFTWLNCEQFSQNVQTE